MKNKKIGFLLTLLSVIIFIIERFGGVISEFFGKIICGENYLKEVDDILSELSCGFDFDIYISGFLFLVFVVGLILSILSFKK